MHGGMDHNGANCHVACASLAAVHAPHEPYTFITVDNVKLKVKREEDWKPRARFGFCLFAPRLFFEGIFTLPDLYSKSDQSQ